MTDSIATQAWHWSGLSLAVGVLVGGAWNAANLWCLSRLLSSWLGPQPSRRRAVGWLVIKFPALYLLVFAYLTRPAGSLIGFGLGFTLTLAAAIVWFTVRAQRLVAVRPHGR